MEKRVLVIAGPTGSGESTITNEVIKRFPVFTRLVTATTRSMRRGEKDKISYYFLSKEKFKNELKKGNIIEYTYVENRDTYYGSYKPDLEKKISEGFNIIVNPDVVGAKYYKKNYNAATIFILPDSIENLRTRLLKREPDMREYELEFRLANAKTEIEKEKPFYDYTVVNAENRLSETVEEVVKILKKEGYALA